MRELRGQVELFKPYLDGVKLAAIDAQWLQDERASRQRPREAFQSGQREDGYGTPLALAAPKMIADFYDHTHPHDSVTRIMGETEKLTSHLQLPTRNLQVGFKLVPAQR